LNVARVAIELVDAGLVAARDGSVSSPSPGIALLDPAGIVTGREAAAQSRLKPVLAFDRFWSDLTTDPLPRRLAEAGSRADLAYLQLSRFWEEEAEPGDEALIVVPGTLRPSELGLLSGIARAAGIPVAGHVDLAVAACASLDARETVLHLDVQLHQAVLTELHGADMLRRRRVETSPRVGLRALQAAWSQLVSETMVRRTRFDPLHQAATEQQLYDRLPGWLGELAVSDPLDIQLETAAASFSVSLSREQFVFAAEAYYAQLFDLIHATRRAGAPVTIALSARAASLPQLAERCLEIGEAQVVSLAEGAATLGALAHASRLQSDPDQALVTALPRATPPRQPRRPRGAVPTHVVYAGRAYAIAGGPLTLGLAPEAGRPLALAGPAAGISRSHCTLVQDDGLVRVRDHSRYGTFVNGDLVAGSVEVAAGDRLRIGTPGVVLELVAVG
jgi:hypothetical protein